METRKVTTTTENYDKQISALKQFVESTECALPYPFIDGSTVIMHRCGGIHPHYYLKSPTTMPKETNTYLYVNEQAVYGSDVPRKSVRVATYKDSNRRGDVELMSAIEDVQVLNNRVIMVKFADGTTEKAVLDESDTFSIEQGIAICMTKKLLTTLTRGNGGSVRSTVILTQMKPIMKHKSCYIISYSSWITLCFLQAQALK